MKYYNDKNELDEKGDRCERAEVDSVNAAHRAIINELTDRCNELCDLVKVQNYIIEAMIKIIPDNQKILDLVQNNKNAERIDRYIALFKKNHKNFENESGDQ